ncbi:hypothetical protein PAXINDRAFT_172843 [Paxillus involutus ATCC 200175]|uniref:Uncharacterized protein n=1 Tax=Paxillus involutus ATCC 200175 TaxID=664439 RepID=A0A0C9TLT3_PAXIN|nr:hypothetical protein PAXINDRAFT_172843 [Paxillus involutus ATCC 200175]
MGKAAVKCEEVGWPDMCQGVSDRGSTTAGRSRTFWAVECNDAVTGGAGELEVGATRSVSCMAGRTDAVPDRPRRREKSAQQEACTSPELTGGAGVG